MHSSSPDTSFTGTSATSRPRPGGAAEYGCTGIRLRAADGATVYGRTMEWGSFDLNSRVAIVPRGQRFTGLTPDGPTGMTWSAEHGFVALDMLGKDMFADGLNEAGLAVGFFYHPGFAEYHPYDPALGARTITAVDVAAFLLSRCASVEDARAALAGVRVVPVVEAAIGIPVEGHWMVTDRTGTSIVVEYGGRELRVFDSPLGVITNAPNYDWHITNLRNYVNLSPVAMPTRSLENLDFAPLGAGSGMIGLPGDFTPPSRFIRAVAWTQTARPTETGPETVYEAFRILDNFNVPLGSAESAAGVTADLEGMRSSTIWTTAWDLDGQVLYYHTQHNRRVRRVRMQEVDFARGGIRRVPLDREKAQDIEDVTPPG